MFWRVGFPRFVEGTAGLSKGVNAAHGSFSPVKLGLQPFISELGAFLWPDAI